MASLPPGDALAKPVDEFEAGPPFVEGTLFVTYRDEAAALDARILGIIGRGDDDAWDFDALACDLFAHQLRYNAPYGAYAKSKGYDSNRLPKRAIDIPAVPAAAFKAATLATFDVANAAVWFETSGTTQGASGRHYLETTDLYTASLLAGFDRALLDDGARLRYLLLVPDPREHPHSSLGFMMARVSEARGAGPTGWYLHDDALEIDAFIRDCAQACADETPVCIAATAFAFVALLDVLAHRELRFALPAGSRIMETGGFKGRTRVVERDDLYAAIADRLGLTESAIVAEYGMTELCSQYYDSHASRTAARRVKVAPPWLRPIVVDLGGNECAPGIVGAIRHIDCANRSSVVAIETEDLGYASAEGLVLLGREAAAELRGCSLDAEDLARR